MSLTLDGARSFHLFDGSALSQTLLFLFIFYRHVVVLAKAVLLEEREHLFDDIYVDLPIHQLLVYHRLVLLLIHLDSLLYILEGLIQDVVFVFRLSFFQLLLDSLFCVILEMLDPDILVDKVIEDFTLRCARFLHLRLF